MIDVSFYGDVMVINVLIIQGEVPHYRLPVFNSLAKSVCINLTVVHSGASQKNNDLCYKEVVVPRKSLFGFHYQNGLRKYVKDNDVVITMIDVHWLSMIPLVFNYPRKIVLWGHGLGKSKLASKFRVFLSKRAAAVLTYGDDAREEFVSNGIDKSKLFYAHNTVHVDEPYYDKSTVRDQFIYVGRLQKRKKIDQLLLAFANANPHLHDGIGLTIVGDANVDIEGDMAAELKQYAIELGISDSVLFTGAIHDESKLKAIFTTALAYVSPGHVGLGVLHSFASGVPVITSIHDGHAPEVVNVIHDKTGLFYSGGVDELTQLLINMSSDDLLATRLRENAYNHYINNCTLDHMVGGFLSVIKYVFEEA